MLLTLFAAAHPIVHVNATLNSLATLLLIVGYLLIRQRKEQAHRVAMVLAFLVSTAFLACYLWYHYQVGSVRFTAEGPVRYIYLAILATHVVLAMTVPFFALAAMWFGDKSLSTPAGSDESLAYRAKHRRVVRWAYPIWLYVSVTGVVVYAMLYHLWPSAEIL